MINSSVVTEASRQPTMKIFCLGLFRIVNPNQEIALGLMSKHKMWMLLKYLIIKKGLLVPTEEIFATLWPEHHKPHDTGVLRTTICRLKAALSLKKNSPYQNSLVIYRKDTCTFNVAYPCWLDFEEFEMLCNTAHSCGLDKRREALGIYMKALDLYQGDFLAEDSDIEWIMPAREYYRRLFLSSTNELAEWLMAAGDYETARRYLEKALKIDPYAEDVMCNLIRALCKTGNVQEAKERYSGFSAMIYNELGVKPSLELRELYQTMTKLNGGHSPDRVIDGRITPNRMNGPFQCEPDMFKNYILIEQRRVFRGDAACMIIIERLSAETENKILNVAERIICKFLRKSDIISLLDHNHLAILLPATDLNGGKTALNNLKKQLKQIPVFASDLRIVLKSIRPEGIVEEHEIYL